MTEKRRHTPVDQAWFADLVIDACDGGDDTAAIAADLMAQEADVHRVVIVERERRLAERQAAARAARPWA